ncbi:MAG: lipocalin family protein [Marinobacter sp.]|nr:lipocalin family protein [Marinobacter sp.]
MTLAARKLLWAALLAIVLQGCSSLPEGVEPVQQFELERYLGTWYEIARLPHRFEEGLSHVTAEYTLVREGRVKVVNQGYHAEKGEWKRAEGTAKFAGEPSVGHLRVSFWGPFYASYVVAALDKKGYQYALVTGPNHRYLWVLSRTPELPDEVRDALVEKADNLGFAVGDLIWVDHSRGAAEPKL